MGLTDGFESTLTFWELKTFLSSKLCNKLIKRLSTKYTRLEQTTIAVLYTQSLVFQRVFTSGSSYFGVIQHYGEEETENGRTTNACLIQSELDPLNFCV